MALASAIPEIVARGTDVATAFNTLSSQCDPILDQFNGCDNDDCTLAICLQLVAVINDCKTSISPLPTVEGDEIIAEAVAEVVVKIEAGLEAHKKQCGGNCPNIPFIYAQVDVSLSACLTVCFNLCIGLVALVSDLLLSVVAVLQDIYLILVLRICVLV